jgi:hypothetical protein
VNLSFASAAHISADANAPSESVSKMCAFLGSDIEDEMPTRLPSHTSDGDRLIYKTHVVQMLV